MVFIGRVADYVKGYVRESEDIDEQTVDYQLSYPTNVKAMRKTPQNVAIKPIVSYANPP